MQWYCQNPLITLSGHISVGFPDSCEDWNVSALTGTAVHPHHPMEFKGKNTCCRQVHCTFQMLDVVFSSHHQREGPHTLFPPVTFILPVFIFSLPPNYRDCLLSCWDEFKNADTEPNLQHAYIRMQSHDWWLHNMCSQMNSSKAFFPTENANKYWFLGHWHTQVLQFILESLAP